MAIINELIEYVDVICSDNKTISDEFKVLPFVESTPGATSFEIFSLYFLIFSRLINLA